MERNRPVLPLAGVMEAVTRLSHHVAHARGDRRRWLSAHCHACRWSGDVLGLIAAVHQLDTRRDFRRVLEIAADLAGVTLRRSA